MAYAFTTKQWAVAGEQDFGEFKLLNPIFSVRNVQIVDTNVYLVLDISENGGIFKHNTHITYAAPAETDINALVDMVVTSAFPEAVGVE